MANADGRVAHEIVAAMVSTGSRHLNIAPYLRSPVPVVGLPRVLRVLKPSGGVPQCARSCTHPIRPLS